MMMPFDDDAVERGDGQQAEAVEGFLLGRTVAQRGFGQKQVSLAEAPPVAHLDGCAVDELAGRVREAYLLHEMLAHPVNQPAEAAYPSVELALARRLNWLWPVG